MKKKNRNLYCFGPFILKEEERELYHNEQPLPLTPKAFETLLYLLQNSGRVLTKQELMQQIWPDSFVEEATLAQNIFTLRRVLGEVATQLQYIETVPRIGYRFIGQVEKQTVPISTKQISGLSNLIDITTTPKIAVLPFEVFISGESASETEGYLGLGLADALITKLSKLSNVVVRPTSSIRHYLHGPRDLTQIGKELLVDGMLTGNIQRLGGRIRATIQFVDVSEQAVVWSDKIDDVFTDVFTIQDTLSEQVARTFALTLTHEEKAQLSKQFSHNQEAYLHYLQGRFHWGKWTKDSFEQSLYHFQHAVQLDAQFALAYVGIAEAYGTLAFYGYSPPHVSFQACHQAVQRALEIDPNLAEARLASAIVNFFYHWDWLAAEREFIRALNLSPHNSLARHSYGSFLMARRRFTEAAAEIEIAAQLDPLSPLISTSRGYPAFFARDYEQAAFYFRQARARAQHFPLANKALGDVLVELGEYDEAIEHYQAALSALGRFPNQLAYLARAYALAGAPAQTHVIIDELEMLSKRTYVSPTALAIAHLGLEQPGIVFHYLEQAFQARCNDLVYLHVQPIFDEVRAFPQFSELTARLGLPESAKYLALS